jgi:cellulose synthase/poly-beta-1,6-N-acetylglucosamine synthase-like glycosyltransferase
MALDPFAGLQVFMENFWIWYNALTPLTFLLTFWPVILIDFVRSVVKSCYLLVHALYRKLRPLEYDPGYLPKVSIIIPAHNEEAIIERAIESALETNYPNKEIIVVDDGSTDRTYQIALPYSKKGDENPITSIARILTDKGIKPEEVLKHYVITLDVDVTTPVLIVSPQLDKESEVYTDQLKLEVIEGSNFKTIIEELEAIVCEQ